MYTHCPILLVSQATVTPYITGKPLAVMIALVATFIVMQNLLGMGVAAAMGMDPKAGLMAEISVGGQKFKYEAY